MTRFLGSKQIYAAVCEKCNFVITAILVTALYTKLSAYIPNFLVCQYSDLNLENKQIFSNMSMISLNARIISKSLDICPNFCIFLLALIRIITYNCVGIYNIQTTHSMNQIQDNICHFKGLIIKKCRKG